jgi:hypothetical protein
VTFRTVRDAARCYEALSLAQPWRGGPPLDVRFCEREIWPPGGRPPPTPLPPTHVWVAGARGQAAETDIARRCADAGVPPAEHLLPVGGRRPGLLLAFRSPGAADAAADAIARRRGGPSSSVATASGPSMSLRSSRIGSRSPPPPLLSSRAPPSPPHPSFTAATVGARPLPPVEYFSRTLWVGQVPSGAPEDAVLSAFRPFGPLAGCRFMRATQCAFIDYRSVADAREVSFSRLRFSLICSIWWCFLLGVL